MKKILLGFALIFVGSALLFSQQDIEKITANFKFTWTDHLLPNSSFLVYHGKEESYFLDSAHNRVPNHSYLDIKTGGNAHFIVRDKDGFHILNTKLERVTKKAYDDIQLNYGSEIELTSGEKVNFYTYSHDEQGYVFTDVREPTPPWAIGPTYENNLELGKVNDSRFKAKRIESLRLGIDMSQTFTIEQKGKNVLVKKGETLVYKGPTKPMLFYDFAITGSKGLHSIYHPASGPKKPILENCDRFWCVGSFLVVSVKGTQRKHVVSNSGDIILSSAGEIRYYDYTLGGTKYSFFCDGRSVVNLNGDVVFKSDGGLVGIGEHYIYSGNSGAYLGNLSRAIKMDCSGFERYQTITIGQTGRGRYRVYGGNSTLIDEIQSYYVDKNDSVIVCVNDVETIVCDPFNGGIRNIHSVQVEGRLTQKGNLKFFVTTKDESDKVLEGRFEPKVGTVVDPKYLKIEWPESKKYHVVVTREGLIRYLDGSGKELFD